MSDERETIEVQLVPMNNDDKQALRNAARYLHALGTLIDRNDWDGFRTIGALRRIEERIGLGYSQTIRIPMPTGRGATGENLMTEKEPT